ncbi:hypothetical protein [Moheibacter stercoris]|uniref:Uncharacterized protein n=1 Tax=Moheibacter stercoris TaxID=1628251 RepID=A0ABV2LUI0_9FLAO
MTGNGIDGVFLKEITTKLLMSFLTVLFINLFILLFVDNMIDYLINFHKTYNTDNINKNPIKFLVENQIKIKKGYRIFFALGSMVMLYGVWFGKN